jgi:NADPH:quinone reductase-like Zn-dependent oxidoreductase
VVLSGYGSEHLDGNGLRHAVKALGDWLRAGTLVPPAHTPFRLGDAAAAHQALEQHRVAGRLLLTP